MTPIPLISVCLKNKWYEQRRGSVLPNACSNHRVMFLQRLAFCIFASKLKSKNRSRTHLLLLPPEDEEPGLRNSASRVLRYKYNTLSYNFLLGF